MAFGRFLLAALPGPLFLDTEGQLGIRSIATKNEPQQVPDPWKTIFGVELLGERSFNRDIVRDLFAHALSREVALIMFSTGLAIIAVDVVGLLALLDALSRLTDGLTA